MKASPEAGMVQRSLSAHSALGLICCALLYLICVSGTAVVLYERSRMRQFAWLSAPALACLPLVLVQGAVM